MTEHIMEDEMTLDKSLKEYRLAANLSVEDVALRLNLKVSLVKSIEDDLDKVIEENANSTIYLRGYLANYSKLVLLPDLESYPEYQKLSHPEKSIKTLKSPHIIKAGNQSTSKFKWFVLLLVAIAVGAVIYNWEMLANSVMPNLSGDSANVEMRLPTFSEDSAETVLTQSTNETNSELVQE